MQDDEIKYHEVKRSLSAPVYLIRFFFIRLTEFDVLVSLISAMVAWFIIDNTGSGRLIGWGLFRLDPWGWLSVGMIVALILSLGHKLRPYGDSEQIVRGWFAHKLFAARAKDGDRYWRPFGARYYETAHPNTASKRG